MSVNELLLILINKIAFQTKTFSYKITVLLYKSLYPYVKFSYLIIINYNCTHCLRRLIIMTSSERSLMSVIYILSSILNEYL